MNKRQKKKWFKKISSLMGVARSKGIIVSVLWHGTQRRVKIEDSKGNVIKAIPLYGRLEWKLITTSRYHGDNCD